MKESEVVAFNYLCNNGYSVKDISFRSAISPDFITSDNKMWEVKLVRQNHISFTYNQILGFHNKDVNIILTTDKDVVCILPFETIEPIINDSGGVNLTKSIFCMLDSTRMLLNKIRCEWLNYRKEHAEEIEEAADQWLKEREKQKNEMVINQERKI